MNRESEHIEERNEAWREATNPLEELTFAELLLIGTHIEGASELVNEELERREKFEKAKEFNETFKRERLGDPDE